MSKWRSRLYGYTGIALVIGLWTPLLWFVVSARRHYGMEMFDFTRMHPFNIVVFLLLCVGTLLAQFGFVLLAQDMSENERRERERQENYAEF